MHGSFCNILIEKNGFFANCHKFVAPFNAFESCVYDMCVTNNSEEVLLQAVNSYAEDCAEFDENLFNFNMEDLISFDDS